MKRNLPKPRPVIVTQPQRHHVSMPPRKSGASAVWIFLGGVGFAAVLGVILGAALLKDRAGDPPKVASKDKPAAKETEAAGKSRKPSWRERHEELIKLREEEGAQNASAPRATPTPAVKKPLEKKPAEIAPLPSAKTPSPKPVERPANKPVKPPVVEKPAIEKPVVVEPAKPEGDKPAAAGGNEDLLDGLIGTTVTVETIRHDDPDWYEVKLAGVVRLENGRIGTLRIEDGKKAKAIEMAKVKRVRRESTTLFESAAGKKETETIAKWRVKPWPQLSIAEHQTEVVELKAMANKAIAQFPTIKLTETKNFLFASNIPANQISGYIAALDRMHETLRKLYLIKPGAPVWKGKALVFAMLEENEFHALEQLLFGYAPRGAYGVCHTLPEGRVVIACFRGDKPEEFEHMLVHETSHGFTHRWLTPTDFHSWLHEGVAELVADQLVPASTSTASREESAFSLLRRAKSLSALGGDFFDPDSGISAWQYGVASSLNRFMQSGKNCSVRQYVQFLYDVKIGLSVEESLRKNYKATPAQLVAAYGEQVVGMTGLRP